MTYDVTYFINKFEAIPGQLWIVNSQGGFNKDEPHCALGHCKNSEGNYGAAFAYKYPIGDIAQSVGFRYSEEAYCLAELLGGVNTVVCINNGNHSEYQQPTPKQRILAALYDIKAMTEPKEATKERIVYVSVPVSITEQSKDLVLS